MKELAIDLHTGEGKTLYEQIYGHIRQDIVSGKFSCGEKLPSTRFLADYLQVSRSTVDMAYGQLLSEGYIESRPYRGYYVCDVSEWYLAGPHEGKEICFDQGEKEENETDEESVWTYDFSPNGLCLDMFSFGVWAKIQKNIILDYGDRLFQSGENIGDRNLRQEISAYLYRARGVNCRPAQIVLGAGIEYLLMLLAQVLGMEHVIAMESPTYLQAYHTFCNLGFPVEAVAMDGEGMRVDLLRRTDASVAYVMPSHQFPMGTVMPMKRRMQLLKWAKEKEGRYIIEDDYDSEFRFKGKPIPSLQGSDRDEKVIYLGTFSKSIAPGIRAAYMVLPDHLMDKYREVCGFYSCTVPRIMQATLCQFMVEGYFERHLNKMRGIYRGRHDLVLNELKKYDWSLRVWGEHSGLHLLVEIDSEETEDILCGRAKERGISIRGLSSYDIQGTCHFTHPILVLGYGNLEDGKLAKAIEELDRIIAFHKCDSTR